MVCGIQMSGDHLTGGPVQTHPCMGLCAILPAPTLTFQSSLTALRPLPLAFHPSSHLRIPLPQFASAHSSLQLLPLPPGNPLPILKPWPLPDWPIYPVLHFHLCSKPCPFGDGSCSDCPALSVSTGPAPAGQEQQQSALDTSLWLHLTLCGLWLS